MNEYCRTCTCYGEPDICLCPDIEIAGFEISKRDRQIKVLKDDKLVLMRHIAFLERRIADMHTDNQPTYGYAIWSSNHGMQEEKREEEKVANV